MFYVILDLIFLLSLGGYTMAHFGQLYEGQRNWEYGTRNGWWWFLAINHVYVSGFTLSRMLQTFGYMRGYCAKNRKKETKRTK